MPAKAQKLGPGLLTFGTAGSAVEFGVALRECTIEPSVDESDRIVVLSGDEIEDSETETYSLKGKIFQHYDRESFLVWAHVNAGTTVPFLFLPSDTGAFSVKGNVRVRRINIGGTVDQRNETDFEFPGRAGMYELVDADSDDPITAYPYPTPPGP